MKRAIVTFIILAVVAGAFAGVATFKTKMDEASIAARQMASVLAVRAPMQSARADLKRYKADIDREIAKGDFNTVDQEIKDEAQACRTIINQAAAALEAHSEFLDWEPPKAE